MPQADPGTKDTGSSIDPSKDLGARVWTAAPVEASSATPAVAPTAAALAAPATSTPTTAVTAPPTTPAADTGSTVVETRADRVLRKVLAQLGIQQAPADGETETAATASSIQLWDPVAAAPAPETVAAPAPRSSPHRPRLASDPPTVRAPPAPVDTPFAPAASSAGGSAAAGGSSGISCSAVPVGSLAVAAPEGTTATSVCVCEHAPSASSSDAARAPPAT